MSERQSTKEKEKSNKSYQEISSKDNNERDFIDFIDKNINLLSAEQYGNCAFCIHEGAQAQPSPLPARAEPASPSRYGFL